MPTYHIHIRGQVQGVGFRPAVFKLAQHLCLKGWVSNTTDGVHIEINTDASLLQDFIRAIQDEAPVLARISGISIAEIPEKVFRSFEIRQDSEVRATDLLLSPDFALCGDCRREMQDPANRRFGYPFITCTLCGPRYSISRALPYDRERTTMLAFQQCLGCKGEYENPLNRRYYSQTNSCAACGIRLELLRPDGSRIPGGTPELLQLVAGALKEGKIIAVKGIGGFLLLGDAGSAGVVRELRRRKHRPSKPFAVLYPDLPALKGDAVVSTEAEALLLGPVSPVVLLPLREKPLSGIAFDDIAPGLQEIGAMLPNAPLLQALTEVFPGPVIATSGNISNAPIVYKEDQAIAALAAVADLFLVHNREILLPQDDSVLRYGPQSGKPLLLRRSRGLAPTLVLEGIKSWEGSFLSMGADLKSAFALLHAGNIYYSQYLGDLDNWQTQTNFRHVLAHLRRLFRAKPEKILADAHPAYFSRSLAEEISGAEQLPLELFQHHEAHFAAVLAEHNLLSNNQLILGMVFDGTGWGRDGGIWGGEFFLWENHQIQRIGHVKNFSHIAGNKMSREPRLSALSMAEHIEGAEELLSSFFSPTELKVYRQLMEKGGMLQSSSMGRVFDAVAACSGFGLYNTFEGEAALRMEAGALLWMKNNGWKTDGGYNCHWQEDKLSVSSLLEQVVQDIRLGRPREEIAAKFHLWAVNAVEELALHLMPVGIAFSGGVFQNALLADLLRLRLNGRFTLYFHQELSPNDENIALGQLALASLGGHDVKSLF